MGAEIVAEFTDAWNAMGNAMSLVLA